MVKLLLIILRWFCKTKIFKMMEGNKALSKVTDFLKNEELVIHIFRYLVAGVLATIVNLVSFILLRHYTELNENICNIISIVLAVLFAYFTNRVYVFNSKNCLIIAKNIIIIYLI